MKYYIVFGLVIVAILVVLGAIWFGIKGPGTGGLAGSNTPGATQSSPGIVSASVSPDAYALALAKAKAWEPDAVLFQMVSADETGNDWNFTFVSPKHAGQGFAVAVNGSVVASAGPTAITASGMPLPANAISPDEAISRAHAVPGYAGMTIVSLQMIYEASAKQWFWGVKMSNGATITIKATQ